MKTVKELKARLKVGCRLTVTRVEVVTPKWMMGRFSPVTVTKITGKGYVVAMDGYNIGEYPWPKSKQFLPSENPDEFTVLRPYDRCSTVQADEVRFTYRVTDPE